MFQYYVKNAAKNIVLQFFNKLKFSHRGFSYSCSELTVSKIAAVAAFDKKLIYEYFGSADNLIDEYIRTKDYWRVIDEKEINEDLPASAKDILELALVKQFEGLRKNKELQKIMLWQLSDSRPILTQL